MKNDKAKAIKNAKMMTARGGTFVVFAYDGTTRTLFGWATTGSGLGRHILGTERNAAFDCYTNARDAQVLANG